MATRLIIDFFTRPSKKRLKKLEDQLLKHLQLDVSAPEEDLLHDCEMRLRFEEEDAFEGVDLAGLNKVHKEDICNVALMVYHHDGRSTFMVSNQTSVSNAGQLYLELIEEHPYKERK